MVSYRPITWILTACLLLTSCGSVASPSPTPFDQTQGEPDSAPENTPLPATPTPVVDYVNQLRNGEYQLGATEGLRVVQLTDGEFKQGTLGGPDYVSVVATDFIDKGELDGTEDDEYVMLVSENYGGSGSFMFMAVYDDVNGTPKFLTSRMVDDRPEINEVSIQDTNEIFLNAVVHGLQDPMCCPTLVTTGHYRLGKIGGLVVTDYTTFTPDGRPRTITIESPEDYTEVFDSVQLTGNVTIAPFENTLVYHIYDAGGVELAIGPITVTAPDLGAPGTFNETISLGDILSNTVIRIDVQDVSAADGSLLAKDSVILVVK